MFENTLLILKPDYLHKRRTVILMLLEKGFEILVSRKILFSPENAAEFLQESVEEEDFMFQVILLTKGNSEAFILTKRNAIQDLMDTMICYFLTSVEMEQKVHVSKCPKSAKFDISFVFPNYIHEPITPFDTNKFCKLPVLGPLVEELYEIQNAGPPARKNWRVELAMWLNRTNFALPVITNACATDEKAIEKAKKIEADEVHGDQDSKSSSELSSPFKPPMSSSSCISCSVFDSDVPTKREMHKFVCAKVLGLSVSSSTISEETVQEEQEQKEWTPIPEEDMMGFEAEGEYTREYIRTRFGVQSFAYVSEEGSKMLSEGEMSTEEGEGPAYEDRSTPAAVEELAPTEKGTPDEGASGEAGDAGEEGGTAEEGGAGEEGGVAEEGAASDDGNIGEEGAAGEENVAAEEDVGGEEVAAE